MNKKPIIVYWASSPITMSGTDSTFLYSEPSTLYSILKNKRNKNTHGIDNFFACPAVSEKFKKTYVFKFPINAKYEYDFTNERKFIQNTESTYINVTNIRTDSITDGPCLLFDLGYIFFSEEPLQAMFTGPYFHKPEYIKYGSIIPGSYDIGNWFRPFNAELQMWEQYGNIEFKENEPLFYCEFITDRPVIIKRFEMTYKLDTFVKSSIATTQLFGIGTSLQKRYNLFKSTRMRDKVLKEVKANLLD